MENSRPDGAQAAVTQLFKEELFLAAHARRRRMLAVATILRPGKGPQGEKTAPTWAPFSWTKHMNRLDEKDFKLRYRVTVDAFYKLLDEYHLREDLTTKDELHAMLSKWGTLVEAETKLAIGLRFLAGGDVHDLKYIYDVSSSYVYTCVWRVVDSINNRIPVLFPLDDEDKLKLLEEEFAAHSRKQVWRGCVGCLDGVHIPMSAPTAKDVEDPLKYYVARKAEYALLCMAVCDYDRRFIFFDISQNPQTHDSLAWELSLLGKAVTAGKLPAPYFINGDSAFSLSPSMVVPSGIDDAFDFEQSSNRMPIECAFGILIRRFGVLYKPLRVKFERRAPLVAACMRLHNFCIDVRIADETVNVHGISQIQPSRWEMTPEFDSEGRPLEHLDIERGPRQRPITTSTPKTVARDRLIAAIRDAGLVRPNGLPSHVHRRQKRKRGPRKGGK